MKKIFLMFFISFLPLVASAQNDHSWYISKTGSDSNNGWTYETAVLTFKGSRIIDSLTNGDTLYIGAGKWAESDTSAATWWTSRGTVLDIYDKDFHADSPAVIRNYPGTFPEFWGDHDFLTDEIPDEDTINNWSVAGALICHSSHVIIDSLRFTHCYNHGIMTRDCDTVIIKNCQLDSNYIRDNGSNGGGLYSHSGDGGWQSQGCQYLYNHIFDNTYRLYDPYSSPGDTLEIPPSIATTNNDGILFLGMQYGIVRGNHIHGHVGGGELRFKGWRCYGNQVDSNILHDGGVGVEIKFTTDTNTVCFNTIYNCSKGLYIYTYSSALAYYGEDPYISENSFYNNTIYNCSSRGVSLGVANDSEDISVDTLKDFEFFNNIIYDAPDPNTVGWPYYGTFIWADNGQTFTIWDYNSWFGEDSASTDLIRYDTLAVKYDTTEVDPLTVDTIPYYNNMDVYTLAEWSSNLSIDENSIWGDPEFLSTDSSNENFLKIYTSSPCATSGRGGDWPTYMGAYEPLGNDHSWYVSNDGDDDNNGWTPETPKQTLNGGILNSLSAGDTLYVMGGTWHESEDPDDSPDYIPACVLNLLGMEGTAESPIVIRNQPGTFPEIWGDGPNDSNWTRWGVTFYESKHIVLDSLRITHCLHSGIMLRGADSIIIQNCQIDSNYIRDSGDNGGGIHIAGFESTQHNYGCQILNNHIFDNKYDASFQAQANAGGIHGHGFEYGIIRGNNIHGHVGGGAIRLKNWGNNHNQVDSNILHDGYSGIEIGANADSNTFCYNVIYAVKLGYSNYHYNSGTNDSNLFYNNTIYGDTLGYQGIGWGLSGAGNASTSYNTSINCFNNIVSDIDFDTYRAPLIYDDRGQTFDIHDYNLYYGQSATDSDVVRWDGTSYQLSEHVTNNSLDENSIWDDPEFLSVDRSSENYLKIDDTSPCATSGRGGDWPSYMGAFEPLENDHSWYVGNDGSDSDNGWTPETPKQTLNGGILNSLSAGDTLYIMGGTYRETNASSCEQFSTVAWAVYNLHGTEENPIVIRNYSDSTMPEIWGDGGKGADSNWTRYGIVVCNSSNIIFDSLRATKCYIGGFCLRNADTVTIQNCQMDSNFILDCEKNGGGIYSAGSPANDSWVNYACTIQHNLIFHNNRDGCTNGCGILGYNIDHSVIRGNTIYGHSGGSAIRMKAQNDHNWIDSNTIYDGYAGVSFAGSSDTNTVCYNVFYDIDKAIYQYTYGVTGSSDTNTIYNNTIYDGKRGISVGVGNTFSNTSTQPATELVVFNNICHYVDVAGSGYDHFNVVVFYDTGQTVDYWNYNSYYGLDANEDTVITWKDHSSSPNFLTLSEHQAVDYSEAVGYDLDSNSIWDDPEFLSVDTSSENFLKIDGTSPCATSGRGDGWPSYMGAYEPLGNDHSWYVGNDGSDSDNGWTPETAQEHLNTIIDSLGAGDTLFIMGGKWNETVTASDIHVDFNNYNYVWIFDSVQGTASQPIVITNYPDSTMPVIRGDGGVDSSWTRRGVLVYNSSHLVFDSLRFTNCFMAGFIARYMDSTTIQYCQIDSNYQGGEGDNGGGIYISGGWDTYDCDGNYILHNHIFENNKSYPAMGEPHNAGGIHCYGLKTSLIRNNTIHGHSGGRGVALKNSCDGNRIDSNTIYDGHEGITHESMCDDDTICYNVIWDVAIGITNTCETSTCDAGGSDSTQGAVIYNNTIWNCSAGGFSMGYGEGWGTFGATYFNNIVDSCDMSAAANHGPLRVRDNTHLFDYCDYNLWYSENNDSHVVSWKETPYTLQEHINNNNIDSNSIWDDPEFLSTNTSSDDFLKINASSPCATSGRGGEWPSYMGAYAPLGGAPNTNLWDDEWSDTVILTSDSDGGTYHVSQNSLLIFIDGTLTFDDTAVDLDNYDNIQIQGYNGNRSDTIKWNTDQDDLVYAILGKWGSNEVSISDVVILHQGGSGTNNCTSMEFWQPDSVWIDDVYADITGVSDGVAGANVVDVNNSPGNGGRMLRITDCDFVSTCDSQSSRSGVPLAVVRASNNTTNTDTVLSITNTNIFNAPHACIRVLGDDTLSLVRIESCSLSVDVNVDANYGDPFAIELYGVRGGSIIRNNYITYGTSHGGGQGIICQGARGVLETEVIIDSNEIHAACVASAGNDEKGVGFYFRWPEGNTELQQQHVIIRDNEISVYADKDDNTGYISPTGEAVRLHFDSATQYIQFIDNIVKSVRIDSLVTDTGEVTLYCVSFCRGDTTDGAYDTIQWQNGPDDEVDLISLKLWSQDISNITISGNNYYSHEHVYSYGNSAASTHSASHIYTYDETFNVNTKHDCDDATFTFGIGAWRGHATDNWVINPTFQNDGDTTLTWGTFAVSGPCDTCTGRNMYIGYTLALLVTNDADEGISGANITIENNQGEWNTGVTNGIGVYFDTLPAFYFWDNNSAKECSIIDTNYLNYKFIASYDGITDTIDAINIHNDWDGQDTIKLEGAGIPCKIIRWWRK